MSRFLRREKEIAETKLEVIQSEANRLKQQRETLERQLRETNAALAEERERSQVNIWGICRSLSVNLLTLNWIMCTVVFSSLSLQLFRNIRRSNAGPVGETVAFLATIIFHDQETARRSELFIFLFLRKFVVKWKIHVDMLFLEKIGVWMSFTVLKPAWMA